MFEGTFKIDRAIREIESWEPTDEAEADALQRVLVALREIRETDAEN